MRVNTGGFGANNPTIEAYQSVKQLNHNQPIVQFLVSIGTGRNLEADPSPSAGYALYWSYISLAAKWAAQSEDTHHKMLNDTLKDNTQYFRLNVNSGVGKIKLDAWKGKKGRKTLDLIRNKTNEYLNSEEGSQQILNSARRLVEIRRARSSDTYRGRWERFCHGVEYVCINVTCRDGKDKRYANRDEFISHVRRNHPVECDNLESFLNLCKQYPVETTPEEATP